MLESSVQVSVSPSRRSLQPVRLWPWSGRVIVTAPGDFLAVGTTTHFLSWAHALGRRLGHRMTGPVAPGWKASPRKLLRSPSHGASRRRCPNPVVIRPRAVPGASAVDSEFC